MNDWRRAYTVNEMADVYRASIAVLNPPVRGDLNMRFFEGMAAGAIVITSDIGSARSGIGDVGCHIECVDLDDVDGVIECVHALAADPDFEERSALCRQLIRSGHTYDHRVANVAEIIGAAERLAPVRDMSRAQRADLGASIGCAYLDPQLLRASLAADPTLALRRSSDWLGGVRAILEERLASMMARPTRASLRHLDRVLKRWS